MKVIVDLSHILYAVFDGQYSSIVGHGGFGIEELMHEARHGVAKRLFSYVDKFRIHPHQLVIAMDSRSWRYDEFPEYKASRKTKKDSSPIDGEKRKQFFKEMTEEIIADFPFQSIKIDNTEADDLIGIYTRLYSPTEKVVIVSRDHDFLQLMNKNVLLWNPIDRKYITKQVMAKKNKSRGDIVWDVNTKDDARQYLLFHILFGDSGDGIPNSVCPNDVYTNPTISARNFGRFGTMTILDKFFSGDEEKNIKNLREHFTKNEDKINRNGKLIDLNATPTYLKEEAVEQFKLMEGKMREEERVQKFKKWIERNELYELMNEVFPK